MILKISISWLATMAALTAAESSDLLRFINGDQLHGSFMGVRAGAEAVWKRDDLSEPVVFKAANLRHVALHGGRPVKSVASLSHIALVNGDRIPGIITGMDGRMVTLNTFYSGILHIPRDQVAMLAPSPLGGRVFYHGPFVQDEWQMAHPSFPQGFPAPSLAPSGKDSEVDPVPGRWRFSGSAWYWQNKDTGTALIRREGMPDRAILRFDLAWKNRLSLAVAFNADFAPTKQGKDGAGRGNVGAAGVARFVPGDSSALPALFGNSYVLHIFSSHMMLYRTSVDGDAIVGIGRAQMNSNNARMGDSGNATIEIRSNCGTGQISLFMDDEFVAQWSDTVRESAPGSLAKDHSGFGFVVQTENSPVRISDVMVAEWNGMPDSARSLQADNEDIVLLSNGLDRFAGTIKSFCDGKVALASKYGEFRFPLDEIAEIRFARNHLAKPVEEPADSITVRLGPLGRITGKPISGDSSSVRLVHSCAGELDLNLDAAVMIDFQLSNNIIDDWNAEF